VFGPDSLFLAGAVAATLVTWFTFLPSFIFILPAGRWSSPPTTN
jgi:chromate transporter